MLLMLISLLLPWLHNWLLKYIKQGQVVLALQKYRFGPLDRIAVLCATMGNEVTYLMLLSLVAWNMDAAIARKTVVCWGLAFYIANYMKDLLLLPRPRHLSAMNGNPHGVVEVRGMSSGRRYRHTMLEPELGLMGVVGGGRGDRFGLPCARAVSALVVPCCLMLLLGWEFRSLEGLFVLAWYWTAFSSRLYLGVHSVMDLFAGGILGLLCLGLYRLVDDSVDAAIAQPKSYIPFLQPLAGWLMLMAYPIPFIYSPSFIETAIVVGAASGWVLGSAHSMQSLLTKQATDGNLPLSECIEEQAECLWLVSLRSIGGVAVLVATHYLCLSFFSGILCGTPLDCFRPMEHDPRKLAVLRNSHCGNWVSVHLQTFAGYGLSSDYMKVGTSSGEYLTSPANGHANGKSVHTSGSAAAAAGTGKSSSFNLSLDRDSSHKDQSWAYAYETAVPVYFLSYLCLGFNAAFGAPLVMSVTGLL
ncbi:unnamed protein product [Chrysoparadoxa australica]